MAITKIAGIKVGAALTQLRRTQAGENQTLRRLSTGLRVEKGSDDPAALIASENLAAERRRIGQAIDNATRATNLANIADAALGNMIDMVYRLQEITSEAATNTLSRAERAALQLEADGIIEQIDDIGTGASFLDRAIFRPNPEAVDGPPPPTPDHLGEVGRATAPDFAAFGWGQQLFDDQSYSSPIVVAGAATYNNPEPGGIRIQNVTQQGFEYRFQEYDYLDGSHPNEQFHWMAFEEGVHVLADGTVIEAGQTTINGTQSTVSLTAGFTATPVVLTQIVTSNDNAAAFARVRAVSPAGFSVYAEEQESSMSTPFSGPHGSETLHYVAITPPGGVATSGTGHTKNGDPMGMTFHTQVTADNIQHNWRNNVPFPNTPNPTVIADLFREDGSDSATLRYKDITSNNVDLRVGEEQSNDSEVSHTTEPVNMIVFDGVGRLDKTPEPPPEPPGDLAEALPARPGDPDLDEPHTSFLFHVAADLPRSLTVLRLAEISKNTLGNGAVKFRDLVKGGKNELTAIETGNNAAQGAIDDALDLLVEMRAHVGRWQEKAIEPVTRFNSLADAAAAKTRSQIREADFAHETSELARMQILKTSVAELLPRQSRLAGDRLLALLG